MISNRPKPANIRHELERRILVLDGAMGTMIQAFKLEENDYRGGRFKDHPQLLKGANDLLSLTRPDVISAIHEQYLDAGSDIIETNTFNANRLSMADYGLESAVYEMNIESAKLARAAADKFTMQNPLKPRFVAGAVGPTGKTLSISDNVSEPAMRSMTFDLLTATYEEQINGLIDGGVDVLLIETIFDTLNAKAAIYASKQVFKKKNITLPLMLSVTISDNSGRTLSGQTPEAFLVSISHASPLAVGFNCSLGATALRPFIEEMSAKSPFFLSVYPNAGLPDHTGCYDEGPEQMAANVAPLLREGLVNIIGGCCGTTPKHIAEIAKLAETATGRQIPEIKKETRLSGLEVLTINKESNFINIGERTNVSGSRKFAKLIREKKYPEALSIARQQVAAGAQVIDINMDDGLLDPEKEMVNFVNLLASEPDISRVPFMIDSSRWTVIEDALKCIQGKAIANSISLKEGESVFIERARTLHDLGAAAIVMAFDENGQAATKEEKIAVCKRAYDLLTKEADFKPEDIFFDANILTIGTGMDEHAAYALNFLEAVKWIKGNLPYAKVSGGVSNLSFSFRGNDALREAMHAAFLYHAIKVGMDMGIVNAGALPVYEDIPAPLLQLVEDLILNRRKDATERITVYAQGMAAGEKKTEAEEQWRADNPEKRLQHALISGNEDFLIADLDEAMTAYGSALSLIEGPLMAGMGKVGDLFGSGKMFLPQVIKSARVMKKAVSHLAPHIEKEKKDSVGKRAGTFVLATVKGDVHDIGKNIAQVVLGCNNFEIIDLGVMVPADKILRTAIEQKADIIGLSGLITPSLDEMIHVAREMEKAGMSIPLMIGGATTSEIHTALRIAPAYSGPVIHVHDVSQAAAIASKLLSADQKADYVISLREKQQKVRERHETSQAKLEYITLAEARSNRHKTDWKNFDFAKPAFTGVKKIEVSVADLIPYIDWTFFFFAWKLNGRFPALLSDPVKGPEATKLYESALELLNRIAKNDMLKAVGYVGFYEANSLGDDVHLRYGSGNDAVLHFMRNQERRFELHENRCLSDYIAPEPYKDYIGLFAVTAGIGADALADGFSADGDDYNAILLKSLADRLAEAFAEKIHHMVRKEFWGYAPSEHEDTQAFLKNEFAGIRPAAGYPCCPDHSEKKAIFELLEVNPEDILLTENYAMSPVASVCGYYFSHPESKYFAIGNVQPDQIEDYSVRKQTYLKNINTLK
ncbi:MAG: methionine synthase [Bacteroidota bacterium]